MVPNFRDVLKDLLASDNYAEFLAAHDSYYLAHGFVQLDANGQASKPWHIGFYSPKKDDLAVFSSPNFSLSFDQAFKDGGKIDELTFSADEHITTAAAFQTVKQELSQKHSAELPYIHIVILQMIDGKPCYNITVVTQAFKMLLFHVDASSGEIIKNVQTSVMDLKADDQEMPGQ